MIETNLRSCNENEIFFILSEETWIYSNNKNTLKISLLLVSVHQSMIDNYNNKTDFNSRFLAEN